MTDTVSRQLFDGLHSTEKALKPAAVTLSKPGFISSSIAHNELFDIFTGMFTSRQYCLYAAIV